METLEQKEVHVDDVYYVFTAMDVVDGLEFMNKLMSAPNGLAPASDIRHVVIKYVKLGGKPFNEKSFGIHFSRKYEHLMKVFEAFMEFNYGEFDPNDGSDTSEKSEKEDTQE